MLISKFSLGQQVRNRLSGGLGVIVDIDSQYTLNNPLPDNILTHDSLLQRPWYYVIIEDESGETIQTYMSEMQLIGEPQQEHLDHPVLDEIAHSLKQQLDSPINRN